MNTRTRRTRKALYLALGAIILGQAWAESRPRILDEQKASLACTICYQDTTAYADPYVCYRFGQMVLIED